MSASPFQFYRTFVPMLRGLNDPVVLSFDNTTFAKAYASDPTILPHHFIHSGNFFSPPYSKKPELRTKERVLLLQEQLVNDQTDGLMTLNVPVNGDFKTPYWKHAKADRLKALETSLEAALWAKKNAQRPDLLYAGFEVGTFRDARYIFERALNAGLTKLSAGFGLFSRLAKFRSEDRVKQFEVLAAYNQLLSEFGDVRFHASGGSSLNALELLAYANVTSADGSSAVIAGLAYGSVLTASGRLVRADKLGEWTCNCEFCSSKNPLDVLNELKRSPEARVRHNVHMVRLSEARINDALENNTIAELTQQRLVEYDKQELWRCYAIVSEKLPQE
jgi:queuine/archaeosine tRNA-ribosyltransferase